MTNNIRLDDLPVASPLRHAANINVDYTRMVSMPVRDMWNDGRIVFAVDLYGVSTADLCKIPSDGIDLVHKAVARIGLDPERYQAWLWDVPVDNPRAEMLTELGR